MRANYYPASQLSLRRGFFVHYFNKTSTLGSDDVLLIVGPLAFVVDYALMPDDADRMVERLIHKLGYEERCVEYTRTRNLLPFFFFN